jgi:hypothetical protein
MTYKDIHHLRLPNQQGYACGSEGNIDCSVFLNRFVDLDPENKCSHCLQASVNPDTIRAAEAKPVFPPYRKAFQKELTEVL